MMDQMMPQGPLSPKAFREDAKVILSDRRDTLKALNDERRKQQKHELDMAIKAREAGVPPPPPLAPTMGGKPMPMGRPTNPEAGPTDTVPAMLTPGEAVIPAGVAQNPAVKPLIEKLVNGNIFQRTNAARAQAAGFAEGTTEVKKITISEKIQAAIDALRGRASAASAPQDVRHTGQGETVFDGRKQKIDKASGYAEGTTSVPFAVAPLGASPRGYALGDTEVAALESSGNPLAQNPNSSARGLYQMTDAARADAERLNPSLVGSDFRDPAVQQQYRDTYKGILANRLAAKGIEPSEDNINRAWVVGPSGYAKVAAAPSDAPLGEVLGQKTVEINPNLQNKTAGQFVNDPNPYSRQQAEAAIDQKLSTTTDPEEATRLKEAKRQVGGGRGFVNPPMDGPPPMPPQNPGNGGMINPDMVGFIPNPYKNTPMTGEQATQQAINQQAGASPVPLQRVEVKSQPITTVDTLDVQADVPRPSHTREIEDYTNTPEVKEQLTDLQREYLNNRNDGRFVTKEEEESWLSKQLGRIYGKSGLFNNDELLRFGIVAAGGMLTGGSTMGSLRYAAKDALNQSDQRHVAERNQANAMAVETRKGQYEAVKNLRETAEKMDTEYTKLIAKASPEARAEAHKLWVASRNTASPTARESLLRGATQLLSANQTGEPDSISGQGEYYTADGTPVMAHFNKEDKSFYVMGDDGQWTKTNQKLITDTAYNKVTTDLKESLTARFEAKLADANLDSNGKKKRQDYDHKTDAKRYTEAFMLLRDELGQARLNPKAAAKIADMTMDSMLNEERATGNKISEEGMRKAFHGASIFARQNNADLYKTTDKEGKVAFPSATYVVAYGDVLQRLHKEGEGKVTQGEIATKLEKEWAKLPKSERDLYKDKAAGSDLPTTGFMIWIKDNAARIGSKE
jgi:LysM repeat protein